MRISDWSSDVCSSDLHTLIAAGLSPLAVAGVFSLDVKADEGSVLELAEALGVPARFFAAATLEAETPRLASPSELVFREVGCHGVAEGTALAAAGPQGRLLVAKTKRSEEHTSEIQSLMRHSYAVFC